MRYFCAFLVLSISLCLGFSVSSYAKESQTYLYTTAIQSPVTKTLSLTAKVAPRQATTVQAPRDGIVTKIHAWPGEMVGNGSLLASLDTTDLKLEQYKLEEERNELTSHLRRVEGLLEQGLIDSKIWDNNLQKLAQIRAQLAVIEEKIKNSQILAPQRGTILWSGLEEGQNIKGADPLFWIGEKKELWLSTKIPEQYLSNLKKYDVVGILADEKSAPVLGRVDFIGFSGPMGSDVNLYISVPRTGEIKIGQTYPILLPIPETLEHIALPENAITEGGYIYKLKPVTVEPDQFFTTKAKVNIVSREKGVVFIDGISAGQVVLLNPQENVEHHGVITAFKGDSDWGAVYATAVLQQNSPGSCGSGSGGSCGGGCGQAGGTQTAAVPDANPDIKMCLVPASIFEVPKILQEEKDLMPTAPDPNLLQDQKNPDKPLMSLPIS